MAQTLPGMFDTMTLLPLLTAHVVAFLEIRVPAE